MSAQTLYRTGYRRTPGVNGYVPSYYWCVCGAGGERRMREERLQLIALRRERQIQFILPLSLDCTSKLLPQAQALGPLGININVPPIPDGLDGR